MKIAYQKNNLFEGDQAGSALDLCDPIFHLLEGGFVNIIQSLSRCIRDCLIATAFLAGGISSAGAATINVSSSSSVANVGGTFSVFFDITGLSAAPGDSLSGFDIDVLYDSTVAILTGFSFIDSASSANQLNFPEAGSLGFFGAASSSGGMIDAFGLSENSAAILDANQANAFRFLSLTFEAIAATALTTIGIDLNDSNLVFVDSGSGLLNIGYRNSAASITIGTGSGQLPEPSIMGLMAVALLAMLAAPRLRKMPSTRAGMLALATLVGSGPSVAASFNDPANPPILIAQASQQAIDGIVTAVEGQRVQVNTANGSTRWLTVKEAVAASLVGKRVTGVVVPAGDTFLLTQPKFH